MTYTVSDMTSSTLHLLPATPATTRVGVIDAAIPPVLEIASGDLVELSTWSLWGNAVGPGTTLAEMLALRAEHTAAGALGPHTLTGPIAVAGAQPGDVLRVDVLELAPGPHGFNMMLPAPGSRGALADEFPAGSIAHYALDRETMSATVAPGVTLTLRPFLGIMGVAPAQDGPRGTAEPGDFGGNMDLAALVAGTTLRLPVHRPGALFYAGDAHACQGDGEVDQMALETTMERALLRLTVERGAPLRLPRAATPEHVIALAFDEDLDVAARIAVDEAVGLIAARRGLAREEAYRLCSLAVDLAVTQLVNGVKGVHARIPRALLSAAA